MKIAIIGAMQEEIAPIIKQLTQTKQHLLATTHYTSGTLNKHTIAVMLSGIGKVNAAMNTALLINHFKPNYIFSTGSAGGLSSNVQIGDVIIANALAYHDVDLSNFGYEYGQIPHMPLFYQPDPFILKTLANFKLSMANLCTGLIVSGDSFISDDARVKEIQQHFPNVCAVEMESCAIAQVCHQHQIPLSIIRAISDQADRDSTDDFTQNLIFVSENTMHVLLHAISLLGKKLEHPND